MNYFISVSYDGSKFYGFQRLKGKETVQGLLESALTKINKSEVLVKGAGRTDRGVHATYQGVSFSLDQNIPPERLVNAINSIVGPYVKVNSASLVSDDFHARFSVKEKTYTYVINMGEFNPIFNDYLYNYNRHLNVRLMKKAAKKLLGPHDFKSFTAGERDNYDSIINSISFKKEEDKLIITFRGKSFYRYMVRNLVGFLIAISEKRIKMSEIPDYLSGNIENIHYTTVPASGLYLVKIKY